MIGIPDNIIAQIQVGSKRNVVGIPFEKWCNYDNGKQENK